MHCRGNSKDEQRPLRPFGSLVLNVAVFVLITVAFVRSVMRHAPGDKVTLWGRGLSLTSFSSCLRLNSSVSRKKTTASNTYIKPHGTPAYTKTNTAAAAHAAAITAHAILKFLNMSILYLQSSSMLSSRPRTQPQ